MTGFFYGALPLGEWKSQYMANRPFRNGYLNSKSVDHWFLSSKQLYEANDWGWPPHLHRGKRIRATDLAMCSLCGHYFQRWQMDRYNLAVNDDSWRPMTIKGSVKAQQWCKLCILSNADGLLILYRRNRFEACRRFARRFYYRGGALDLADCLYWRKSLRSLMKKWCDLSLRYDKCEEWFNQEIRRRIKRGGLFARIFQEVLVRECNSYIRIIKQNANETKIYTTGRSV
jgi:hypothetical protein